MFRLSKFLRKSFRVFLAFCSNFWSYLKYSLVTACIILFVVGSCVTTQSPEYRVGVTEPAILRITTPDKKVSGTGFRFTYNGKTLIATAGHVCKSIQSTGQQPVVLHRNTEKQETMLLVGLDTDACVISDSVGGRSLKLNFDHVSFAEEAYTIGFSGAIGFTYGQGQTGQYVNSYYPGLLLGQVEILECVASGMMPTFTVQGMVCPFKHQFLATNIPLYFGQSGSPLLNKNGEVIGIASMTQPNGSFWTTMEYFKPMVDRVTK